MRVATSWESRLGNRHIHSRAQLGPLNHGPGCNAFSYSLTKVGDLLVYRKLGFFPRDIAFVPEGGVVAISDQAVSRETL